MVKFTKGKRKFIFVMLIISMGVFMISCGDNKELSVKSDKPKVPSVMKSNDAKVTTGMDSKKKNEDNSKIDNSKINNNKINNVQENVKEDKILYMMGSWKISKISGYGSVCAYGEEEIKKLIGEKVEFSNKDTVYYDVEANDFKRASNLVYDGKDQLATQYAENYKVNMENIGLVGDKVSTMEAKDKNDNVVLSLVTDGKKVLMNIGNVYLELIR